MVIFYQGLKIRVRPVFLTAVTNTCGYTCIFSLVVRNEIVKILGWSEVLQINFRFVPRQVAKWVIFFYTGEEQNYLLVIVKYPHYLGGRLIINWTILWKSLLIAYEKQRSRSAAWWWHSWSEPFFFATLEVQSLYFLNEPRREKTRFLHMRKQRRRSASRWTAKLISAFVFTTWIVQSLCFPNLKFQASSHLPWLSSPILGRTWSETPKTGFLTSRLKLHASNNLLLLYCATESHLLGKPWWQVFMLLLFLYFQFHWSPWAMWLFLSASWAVQGDLRPCWGSEQ